MPETLTHDAREIVERATEFASARGSKEVLAGDVLKATLQLPGSLADNEIRALGLDPKTIAAQLPPDGDPAKSPPLNQLLVNAGREAQVLGHYQVDSIHLLLALLYSDSPSTSAALQKAGLSLYDLRSHVQTGSKAAQRYHNLLMSLILPILFLLLGGIALPGGAVYINHSALRTRAWSSAVALAGPVGTLLCGLLIFAVFSVAGRGSLITVDNENFFGALAALGF